MADEKKEKKEGKKGLPFVAKVLIIAIVLVLIVVISVGSAFFIASKVNKSNGDGSNTVEQVKVEEEEKVIDDTKFGTTIEFGEYTINLNEAEPRYLVVKINFELDPEIKEKKIPDITADIETKKVILQDRVLSILRAKSIADLSADTDFVKLKKEITDEVNRVLGEKTVKAIRFNNWLIQ